MKNITKKELEIRVLNALLIYLLFIGVSFLLIYLAKNIHILYYLFLVFAVLGGLGTLIILICYLINRY